MNQFDIIGFPINLGCDRNGNELTPSLLRESGCFTSSRNLVNDLGDISCISREVILKEKYNTHPKIKFLQPILESSQILSDKVLASINRHHIPLCIGGDHVMALGSIAGVGLAKGAENYAVIYIDAHGDFNTEQTSSTGNMHGMHLAYLMGKGEPRIANLWGKSTLLNPKNAYFLGPRALDLGEKELANELGIYIKSSEELNRCDPTALMSEIINDIRQKGIEHIHLSFDVDVIDPKYAPGTGVPEANGITPALTYTLVRLCMQTGLIKSIDIVELNSLIDIEKQTETIIKNILRLILR